MKNDNEIIDDWRDIEFDAFRYRTVTQEETEVERQIIHILKNICSDDISGEKLQEWMEEKNIKNLSYYSKPLPSVIRNSNITFLNNGEKCILTSVKMLGKSDYDGISLNFNSHDNNSRSSQFAYPKKLIYEKFPNSVFNYYKIKYRDKRDITQYIFVFCRANPYCNSAHAVKQMHKKLNKLQFRRFIEKFVAGQV